MQKGASVAIVHGRAPLRAAAAGTVIIASVLFLIRRECVLVEAEQP
jgi:hypothetical protein